MSLQRRMTHRNRAARLAPIALGTGLLLGLAGCSAPGSGSSAPAAEQATEIDAPVTAEQVAELGDVTLHVWADQGEQDLMDAFVPAYEKMYPNVDVEIQFKSYNDLTATVVNAMNSDDAPDVTQGNQGWATDGALVKAGLIRPLDDVADAYGYRDAAGSAITQLEWSEDGKTFGSGSVYGMSPDNQMVGLFYNKEKLAKLGAEVPASLDDFEATLEKAAKAGELPISLGNSDKAAAMQAFSLVQGVQTPAEDTRAWIAGEQQADFAVPSNVDALKTFASWADRGYFTAGYDGSSPDDAAAAFAGGDGVFFVGGNWFASTISDADTFGFTAGFEEGGYATAGSFGMPWHVSSKSDAELAAVAWVGMLNSEETAPMLADVQRVPVHGVEAGDGKTTFGDLLTASSDQLQGSGPLFWYDWATDTMFDTFTGGLQETMAGRTSPEDLAKRIQEDWSAFHA